jgi:Protein of unknown function (DUF2950)
VYRDHYATEDRNKNGIPEYARNLISSAGKRDGLFWPESDAPKMRRGVLEYVQHGAMIGGLAAWSADYRLSGIQDLHRESRRRYL